jgi:hypothetical protein
MGLSVEAWILEITDSTRRHEVFEDDTKKSVHTPNYRSASSIQAAPAAQGAAG